MPFDAGNNFTKEALDFETKLVQKAKNEQWNGTFLFQFSNDFAEVSY